MVTTPHRGVRAGTEQAHHTLLKDAGSQAAPQQPSIPLSLATTPSGQGSICPHSEGEVRL